MSCPTERAWHPAYAAQGGVPALETVRFSLVSHRGCCGECSFCSLSLHQGRMVQSRSRESLVQRGPAAFPSAMTSGERLLISAARLPISTLLPAAGGRRKESVRTRAVSPRRDAKILKLDYKKSIELLRSISRLPGIKHAFIGSGFRYDLLIDEGADRVS